MISGPRHQVFLPIAVAALVLAVPGPASTRDNYPTRTIKIVVPLPPGGNADVLPRIIANKLAARWAQSVIIENKPGAAQNLGAEFVAKAEPDGHTLLATPQGPLVVSQSFFAKLGFDPAAFVPISVLARQPLVLVANPKVPAATLRELIAYAKASPGKINFASPGIGSSPHLTGEMLQSTAGIRLTHVPYRGLAPATVDLLAGQVDISFDNLGNTLPLIRERKLKPLAVASRERIAEFPDVPAIAEMYPGFYSTSWFAMVAPPRTRQEIAGKISQALVEVLRSPEVADRFRSLAVTPVGTSPAETAAFLKEEALRWRQVIITSGLRPK